MDEDEMKLQILQAANKTMKASRLYKLPGHRSKPSDFGLWKLKCPCPWAIDNAKTNVRVYTGTFVPCIFDSAVVSKSKSLRVNLRLHITFIQRGKLDEENHAHDKDKSKHLKVQQLHAILIGVHIAVYSFKGTYSIWLLLNFLCSIATGWLLQLNGNAS
jgi:hypothetical protein